MTDAWLGDACSLVDAFRRGDLSPREALEASLAAIETSEVNAFSFLDADRARRRADAADVSLPFGGIPIGIKELEHVEGWPYTEASVVFHDRVSTFTSTMGDRLLTAGVVPVGMTTSSEVGFVNWTSTKLNGTTRNPWKLDRTPGGSSGGSAAAVAGGLVPIASGGDGGGSIRIPSGYSGLFGLKSTFGRIPRGPQTPIGFLNVCLGCVARSVRDAARWFDVCNGYDPRDPFSLPRVEGWEAGLGSQELRGLRVAVAPDLGATTIHSDVRSLVTEAAETLIAEAGLVRVDATVKLPENGIGWGAAGLPELYQTLKGHWPACRDDLTEPVQFGAGFFEVFSVETAAIVEEFRVSMNEAFADLFEQVDLVVCATNPYEAFDADGPPPTEIEGTYVTPFETGALTIPGNISGHPAVSIPAGPGSNGLPIGMQVYGRRHAEQTLLDVALTMERARPWPLTAPGSPR
jgi:aspartyl-tRNA(Asn)/glutamyl-tRNA(Gln) amidotransferase subunit A